MTRVECETTNGRVSWQEVDRRLSTIARQRAALDAEEARWLREAARVRIWREVGCVSLLDYLERKLGYGPRVAHDRVRVALALEELPALEQALAGGMPFTAVRELTRVATRDTEKAWIDACRGKSVHEIESAVSGHRKGSLPSDATEPDLATRTLTFEEILPSTIALLRQARQKAQEERGVHLSDNDLLALAFGAIIDGGAANSEHRGRAKFQIAVKVCDRCGQGWQEGGGRQFAMEKADVERARCDAQYIGCLDGEPGRATQDIPPSVRRFVLRRDGGKCTVPGCRSTSNLEIHHLRHRANGGSHDPSNLTTACDGCHAAEHRGAIEIGGCPGKITVKRRDLDVFGPPAHASDPRTHVGTNEAHAHVGPNEARPDAGTTEGTNAAGTDAAGHAEAMAPRSRFERTAIRTRALDALVTLGFKRHEARAAVDQALDHFGDAPFTLETFLRIALSRSPRPRMG